MLELDRPTLDWVSLARGMGVDAERVTDVPGLVRAYAAGLASGGPNLIEVVL